MKKVQFKFMREGWSIRVGTIEELENERSDAWRQMTPQQRLDAMVALVDAWKGPNARRLERTYRIVKCEPS